ncbi:MAG: PEGA domain-containing protein, partial [Spirochaetaceae bacterium]|nr:PEGA domain-containing protein [Spirochaetaceae bacterium]
MNILFRASLLVLGVGLFLPPLSVSGDTIQQLEGSGLAVASDPPGASVYLDGIKEGITPLVLPVLPAASYAIRLSKEGYFDRELRVTVPREGRLSISLNLERAAGNLLLRVRPSGPPELPPFTPLVYVDGVLMPGLSLVLDEGSHSVRVRAFGWEDVYAVVYVKAGETRVLEAVFSPAPFGIRSVRPGRRRFNPADSGSLGSTAFSFDVSAPGRGTFLVLDHEGRPRFQRELGPFTTWSQSVSWDGRDQQGAILPDGSYTLRIEAEDSSGTAASAVLEAELDSSFHIIPSQTSAAVSGLSWAPGAALNPPLSWQVEGTMLFGRPVREDAWQSLPFAVALGVSAFERLEIGAAANMTPRLEGKTPFAPGLSLKLGILRAGSRAGQVPLNLALGLRYGFFDGEELSPFGLPSGPEFFLP